MDLKTFLARAKNKHGDKFDYTHVKEITTWHDLNLVIVCPIHGKYTTSVNKHLRYKYDCLACAAEANKRDLNIINGMKTCPKCGHSFPRTREYFNRHSRVSDGLNIYCKTCSRKLGRESAKKERGDNFIGF